MNIWDFLQRFKLHYRKNDKKLMIVLLLGIGTLLFPFSSIGKSPEVKTETNTSNFPESLPSPSDESMPTEINTPEYVIIRPSEQATFSSEIIGSIEILNVKEGESFNKGDILLQFDCRLQKAELNKALAVQMQGKMALTSAKKLQSYGSISQFELTKANADAQMANADVEKLRAMVDKCIITAPFKGAVSQMMVHTHETVKPGDPLLKIISTENLEFEIQLPSSWLTWLHVGSPVNIHLNEINKIVPAKITRINPEIEPVSESVKMTATITSPDPTLLPGMSGQAEFPEAPENHNSEKKK